MQGLPLFETEQPHMKKYPDQVTRGGVMRRSCFSFSFPKRGNCEVLLSSYIGMTTTKLSRRLTCHLTSGAPKSHLLEKHGITITRKFLEENTEMVDMCADVRRLPILEALYIKDNYPKLNVQAHDLQALPSMRRTKGSDIQSTETQSMEEEKPSTNERRPLTGEAARLLFK
ncbi:hypothetical protein GWK47_007018 [Chionoecetes opilio]|uniref:Uncharacterized protein n=1 Tax=Chionoecetes opilio TaxID=41210 RepID=A0A8J4Y3N0_CHIOP|nr:hypothetical protein GWK47_007018 [Chionoecetes opilio]